ncbi:MAG: VWA domain-containing protein [Acidobacteriota bacterium]
MTGCKRATTLLLVALWIAPAPGAEGMRILTFVPGVAQGRLPVTVDLGSAPPPAELLLDGKSVCRVTSRRQTCTVDLGPAPRVRLLELVRRGSAGRAERVRRWVNKPSVARAEVLPRTDCVRASGPCTLSVAWSHEQDLDPALLSVSIDGKKAYEGPPKDVAIPFAAERPVRVVAVDLSFVDGQRASETLLIGSGTSSAVEAPLNAVVVSARGKEGAARSAPATLGGRLVRAAEPGESDLLFFVAPSAVPKLLALEAGAQKSFSKTNSRLAKLLEDVTHVIHFSPLATRASYRTAAEVSDRLFRLQGFDCTPGSGHRELILPCVDASVLTGGQYRLAATVTSGAFVRAATPRRRVAVVVLGDDESSLDESVFGPTEARAYLSEIFVPLVVWRLGRAGGGAWGEGRRVSTPQEFVDAWASLRAELDAQQICWVAEDLDPASFRLAAGDEGLVLAGRGAGAEPLVVASAAEPEEPGTPVASTAAAPGKQPSKKSVTASQEVGLVNLDAFVVDGKGRRVTGLKASDFTLRVGGKPVAITNFSEYAPPAGAPPGATSLAPPAPGETAAAPAERPKRRVVLFVDRLTLGDRRRSARFFGSVKDFVVRTIQPGDEAAVLTFDESLATRVAFTGDTFAILKALDDLTKESARPPAALTGVENTEKLVAEIAQAEREMAQRESGRGGIATSTIPTEAVAPQAAPISGTILAEMRGLAAQEWGRTKNKAAALRAVLTALGGLDGRRVLVIASHRLSRWSGMEYFLTKRLDVDVQVPPDAHEFDARQILLDLSEAANAYGVTLHGLYPEAGGDFDLSVMQASVPQFTGQTMNGRRGIWIDANENEGLHLAVDPTGGVVGFGAEQAGDALAGAAVDLESFYSLGFPVEGLTGGKPLEIDLKVAAPGAKVRTRRAVALRSAVDRAIDRTVSNLFSRAAAPGLPIQARVTSTTPAEKGRVKVAFEVTIPASSLALLPAANARVAKIAAFVALLDRGDVTQGAPVRQEFRTGEDAFADAEGIFTFTSTAVVNPGAVISIGILDEATQESGYARIEVPGGAKK